jgi:hypothetical protein
MTCVDALVAEHGGGRCPRLLKLDLEGMELEVRSASGVHCALCCSLVSELAAWIARQNLYCVQKHVEESAGGLRRFVALTAPGLSVSASCSCSSTDCVPARDFFVCAAPVACGVACRC